MLLYQPKIVSGMAISLTQLGNVQHSIVTTELGTANLNSIPQPQIPQNSNGWSATANPQVCGTFAVIFCTSATANDFSLPQTRTANFAVFFLGLINRGDL